MWDLLEIALEFLSLFDSLDWWRFWVCVLLSLALVGFINWLIPDDGVCLVLSVPVIIAGIGTGALWQWSSRKY